MPEEKQPPYLDAWIAPFYGLLALVKTSLFLKEIFPFFQYNFLDEDDELKYGDDALSPNHAALKKERYQDYEPFLKEIWVLQFWLFVN